MTMRQGVGRIIYVTAMLTVAALTELTISGQTPREWRDYAGGPDSSRFVAATQITKANVQPAAGRLDLSRRARPTSIRSSCAASSTAAAPNDSFVALDAATGKEIWIHEGVQGFNARGMNYWESKDGKDRRLIFSANNILQEIDAQTGKSIHVVRRRRPGRSARRSGSRSGDDQPADAARRGGSSRT